MSDVWNRCDFHWPNYEMPKYKGEHTCQLGEGHYALLHQCACGSTYPVLESEEAE